MKGFVPTPEPVVDRMVSKLFADLPPREGSRLLDPGCGTGAFIEGVLRWGQRTGSRLPAILGIDSDPVLLNQAAQRIGSKPGVTLAEADFLGPVSGDFDYIIGNPPYVSITGLTIPERETYRRDFVTAVGRFDLYSLFFEQSLRLLKPHGRLVFITPEKFTYVESAARLRKALAERGVREVEFIDEATFEGLVTYPAIATIKSPPPNEGTRIVFRSGESKTVKLPATGVSWLPYFAAEQVRESAHVLSEACVRVSCGVATGADQVYVCKDGEVSTALRPFAYRTISGRGLAFDGEIRTSHSMLVPYSRDGRLLAEEELGALGPYLLKPENHERLLGRTCTARKPWYAFHENPPMADILLPKILCKDIASRPRFVVDQRGDILPRHSVYYLVPTEPERIHELCRYLNSAEVGAFLEANCQRAANGFIRLQSHILKRIPLPAELVPSSQLAGIEATKATHESSVAIA